MEEIVNIELDGVLTEVVMKPISAYDMTRIQKKYLVVNLKGGNMDPQLKDPSSTTDMDIDLVEASVKECEALKVNGKIDVRGNLRRMSYNDLQKLTAAFKNLSTVSKEEKTDFPKQSGTE